MKYVTDVYDENCDTQDVVSKDQPSFETKLKIIQDWQSFYVSNKQLMELALENRGAYSTGDKEQLADIIFLLAEDQAFVLMDPERPEEFYVILTYQEDKELLVWMCYSEDESFVERSSEDLEITAGYLGYTSLLFNMEDPILVKHFSKNEVVKIH